MLALLSLLATTATIVSNAAPARAASSITMLQFNMCGSRCNNGGMTVAQDVVNSVNNHANVQVITLNEVCQRQYNYIYTNLSWQNTDGSSTGYFTATVPGGCTNGDNYGIAVLVRTRNFTRVGSYVLPNPGGNEPRRLTCLKTSSFGGSQPLLVCVTHVDYHSENIAPQVNFIASKGEQFWNANKVVIAGDFNTRPWTSPMSSMYATDGGTGIFYEADLPPSGSVTYVGSDYNEPTENGSKIDYIFLSKLDFTGYSADATSAPHSDHVPLWGNLTWS